MNRTILACALGLAMGTAVVTPTFASATYKLQTAAQKAEDWKTFKTEQEQKIKKNDERIAELKKAKAADGKVMDAAYQKEIERLQAKNAELRTRIVNYKYDESKWAQFKREFNHDMDELGKSLKDIGKDNVK